MHLRLLLFPHYGKLFIKATKLHPDFFMQMAIQLAHYRMHHAFAPTYETGHTRAFYHGRTDTVRTCSLASCTFVRTMEDASATAADKWSALKAACDSHGEQLQRVLTGQGVDRHMLGLLVAAHLSGEQPAIFSDPAFKRSGGGGNDVISNLATSTHASRIPNPNPNPNQATTSSPLPTWGTRHSSAASPR